MGSHEQIFRFCLLIGILIVIPVLRFHRVRARAAGDRLDRRAEGTFILYTLRPFAVTAFLCLILYIINPRLMSWSSVNLPLWMRWIGLAGAATSAVLLLAVLISLGRNLTDTVVTRASHTLVTTGPYRFVRHPFYAAFALGLASNAVVTANWFLGLCGFLTIVLVVLRTKTEEQKLVERFGSEYSRYMATTGRFVPRLLKSASAPPLTPHELPVRERCSVAKGKPDATQPLSFQQTTS